MLKWLLALIAGAAPAPVPPAQPSPRGRIALVIGHSPVAGRYLAPAKG